MTDNINEGWVRQCKNSKCPRHHILVFTDRRRCSKCESRLRAATYNPESLDETPPLVDMLGDATEDKPMTLVRSPETCTHKDAPIVVIEGRTSTITKRYECGACGTVLTNDQLKEIFTSEKDLEFIYRADGQSGGTAIHIKPSHPDRRHPAGYLTAARSSDKNDTFTCEADISGCPVASNMPPRIEIPLELFARWIYCAMIHDTEWIAYLTGEAITTPREGFRITDMYIPTQEATGSWCKADDGQIEQPNTIGAVHSHVGMSVFFSGTDKDHANHVVELVVNNKFEIESSIRTRLECGRYQRTKGSIVFIGSEADRATSKAIADVLREKKDFQQPTKSQGNFRYQQHKGSQRFDNFT